MAYIEEPHKKWEMNGVEVVWAYYTLIKDFEPDPVSIIHMFFYLFESVDWIERVVIRTYIDLTTEIYFYSNEILTNYMMNKIEEQNEFIRVYGEKIEIKIKFEWVPSLYIFGPLILKVVCRKLLN